MTSITEVARRAGVSIATASRVVGAVDYPVSAATRARVLEAARTLDYVPNALARGLHKSHIPVVGVVVHDITDPYFAEIVRGVEDAASASGYLVVICSSEMDPERENSHVLLLRSMRAAAVIICGSGVDDARVNAELERHLAGIRANGSAVVHLSPPARGVPEIGIDNEGGVAAMVGALVGLGHSQIAFLAGPQSLYVARQRTTGYRRGMVGAGIAPDSRLVVHSTFDIEGGARSVDRLLAAGTSFTAISCANDLLALGAIRRLVELGRDVPRDVSVAGFDDISIAAMTSPSLTTVRLPLREMGRRGFEKAIAQLAGSEVGQDVMPTEIIMRDSTAPPPTPSTQSRGTP